MDKNLPRLATELSLEHHASRMERVLFIQNKMLCKSEMQYLIVACFAKGNCNILVQYFIFGMIQASDPKQYMLDVVIKGKNKDIQMKISLYIYFYIYIYIYIYVYAYMYILYIYIYMYLCIY